MAALLSGVRGSDGVITGGIWFAKLVSLLSGVHVRDGINSGGPSLARDSCNAV